MIWNPGNELNLDKEEFIGYLNNYSCVLEKHHYTYSLRIEGISSIEECEKIIKEVKVAINWLSLKRAVGIKIPEHISDVNLYKEPIKITEKSDFKFIGDKMGWDEMDGDYYADQLIIIPEYKRLTRWEMGKVRALLRQNPSMFFDDLNECLNFDNLDDIIKNKKLLLAVELYSAFKFEGTTTGKFLKLVTVLEALLPNNKITGISLNALEIAKGKVKEFRNDAKKSGEDINEINHLLSRLGNLKSKSIGSNLNEYIKKILSKYPSLGDPAIVLPEIKEIYNARSTLLHSGEYDETVLEKYIATLAEVVPRILKVHFNPEQFLP